MSSDGVQTSVVDRIVDVTIGRFHVAASDPRNVEPFLRQCRADVSDLLNTFVAALKQQGALTTADIGSATTTTTSNVTSAQRPRSAPGSAPGSARAAIPAPEQQQQVYQQMLKAETDMNAWRDMCTDLVDELEAAQQKAAEAEGRLLRREALLKEMRVAYYTELSHYREMVRQYRTKGTCMLHDMSTFNWAEDAMSEQRLAEQTAKAAQALEDERQRHQRELDMVYERYMTMNEHLRSQVSALEREQRTSARSAAAAAAAMRAASVQTDPLLPAAAAAGSFSLRISAPKPLDLGADALEAAKQKLGQSIASEYGEDVDDDNGGGDGDHEGAATAAAANASSKTQQPAPPIVSFESGSSRASPANPALSRLASALEHRDSGMLSAPGAGGSSVSYPATPVPLPPTPSADQQQSQQLQTKVPSSSQSPASEGAAPKAAGGGVVTAAAAHAPTAAAGKKRPGPTPPLAAPAAVGAAAASGTTSQPSSGRGSRPTSARNATSTAKRPSSAKKPHPKQPQQQRGAGSLTSSPNANVPLAATSPLASPLDPALLLSPTSQYQQNAANAAGASAPAGVSEGTLKKLMDSHKRALEAVRRERDAANAKLSTTREQLGLALKRVDRMAADAEERDADIDELRRRLGGDGDGSGGDAASGDKGGGQQRKSALEIRATNVRLRDELLRKNQLLEARTKELVQLQEETARWFDAFRAIHPADRSPINFAVLERLAAAVQRAEAAESRYRSATWRLLAAQLEHKRIIDSIKAETAAVQNKHDAASVAATRTQQRHAEIVFSQLWRATAKMRQLRGKLKLEANLAWDVVLFTARALVNHEDIAVVNAFEVISGENAARPALLDRGAQAAQQQRVGEQLALQEQQKQLQQKQREAMAALTAKSEAQQQPKSQSAEVALRPGSAGAVRPATRTRSPELVGDTGIPDIAAVSGTDGLSHARHKMSSRSMLLLGARPGSAASNRAQTPISAIDDLRAVPLSQVVPLAQQHPQHHHHHHHHHLQHQHAQGTPSVALRRQQALRDLSSKQRQVDEIKMRALRYYSTRSAAAPTSPDRQSVEPTFQLHTARLFGRNEDV